MPTEMKPDYKIVSLSGGKDSTAMLLRLIEEGAQIDEIVFCDTGMEFPGMYEHIEKVQKYINRPITTIKSDKSFEWYMFEHKPDERHKQTGRKKYEELHGHRLYGYSWPSPIRRWCTKALKQTPFNQYIKKLKEKYNVQRYIGLAADETNRLERVSNKQPDRLYPLVDWGMTEAECLQYCYTRGFNWGGCTSTLIEFLAGAVH